MKVKHEFKVWEEWTDDPKIVEVDAESNEHAWEVINEMYPNAWRITKPWMWCFITQTCVPVGIVIGIILYVSGFLPLFSPDKTTGEQEHERQRHEQREQQSAERTGSGDGTQVHVNESTKR